MLLYGGLVPSRIHCDTEESLQKRLTVLKDIRKRNPEMVIYGFQVVMRCPNYSSSDEEPDYYEIYGAQIHKAGEVIIPGISEPPARTLRATVPENERHIFR